MFEDGWGGCWDDACRGVEDVTGTALKPAAGMLIPPYLSGERRRRISQPEDLLKVITTLMREQEVRLADSVMPFVWRKLASNALLIAREEAMFHLLAGRRSHMMVSTCQAHEGGQNKRRGSPFP